MISTAWVLLWMWGTTMGFAVPGIASKEACEDLAQRMTDAQKLSYGNPNHLCIEYQIASPKN